jgi:hypothetical protein
MRKVGYLKNHTNSKKVYINQDKEIHPMRKLFVVIIIFLFVLVACAEDSPEDNPEMDKPAMKQEK